MKSKVLFSSILVAGLMLSNLSVVGQKTKEKDMNKTDTTKCIIYTCPMHPEVVQSKPDKCPKCGMNLVEKKVEKTKCEKKMDKKMKKTTKMDNMKSM